MKKAVLIYSSETFAKRRAIFLSVRKTVNIQGYIPSYGSQSKRAKIAIQWFGKYIYIYTSGINFLKHKCLQSV